MPWVQPQLQSVGVAGAPGLDLHGRTIDHNADLGDATGVVVDVDPGAFELVEVAFNRQQGQQRQQRQDWVSWMIGGMLTGIRFRV